MQGIDELRKTGFGWVTPQGVFLNCDPYSHMSSLKGSGAELPPNFEALLEAVEALERKRESDEENFAASVEGDDHPGWHRFHSRAQDEIQSLRNQLMVWLHRTGWMRLGTFKDKLEAEGCPLSLRANKSLLEDASLFLNMKLVMTPTTWRPERQTTRLKGEDIKKGIPEFYEAAMESFRRSKFFKGGGKERDIRFSVTSDIRLDRIKPQNITIHLPRLLTLWPYAEAPRWNYQASGMDNGADWVWNGPFPEYWVEDMKETYFKPLPDENEIKSLLERTGAKPSYHHTGFGGPNF